MTAPQNWSRGSSLAHQNSENKQPISARADASCTMRGEGGYSKFEPAQMILADSTAAASQNKTQNRSRGSSWMRKNKSLIWALAGASCTMLVGGRLGHVWACMECHGLFYRRGNTGPNTDFIPKNRVGAWDWDGGIKWMCICPGIDPPVAGPQDGVLVA